VHVVVPYLTYVASFFCSALIFIRTAEAEKAMAALAAAGAITAMSDDDHDDDDGYDDEG